MSNYVMTVRAVNGGQFISDVGDTQFLIVPENQQPSPTHAVTKDLWYAAVLKDAIWDLNPDHKHGDILFIVHGYNMSEAEVIGRHRLLQRDLTDATFKGCIVSFDWPSGHNALAYLEDRHKAKATAMALVSDGIAKLSELQTPDCPINVHLLGHSTGAYVLREAFHDADDRQLANSSWIVSQVIFAAGDVSANSMSESDRGAESIYHHSVRLTNYSSRHDEVLGISNVKRVGVAPRVGRIGLPSDAPSCAVNVDCTTYYEALSVPQSDLIATDQPSKFVGMQSHSWYFGNRIFAIDLFNVIIGTDRFVIKTRDKDTHGNLLLKHI